MNSPQIEFSGKIISGHGRGRKITVPTLNIIPIFSSLGELSKPEFGVYAGKIGDFLAAMNYGPRPTFGEEEAVLECHLLDFQGEWASDFLQGFLGPKLRDVVKFESAELLTLQIKRDIAAVREWALAL